MALTDPVNMNKGELMEMISDLCMQYRCTNYDSNSHDVGYTSGAIDAIQGVREYICQEILHMKN